MPTTRGKAVRRRTLPTLAALAVGLVAGCTPGSSSAPDPTVAGTRAAAVTPAPTPTPTDDVRVPPERPAAWDDVSVDGAIAVATYFLELYGYTYATADSEQWIALSHPECVYCADVRTGVHDMAMEGQHTEGGALSLRDQTATEVTPQELFSVDAVATQAALRMVNSSGVAVSDWTQPEEFKVNVLVLRDKGRWYIRGVNTADVDGSPGAAH
ncbi:DUF6318 family protein [Cellulomonas sp. URHB0016]